MSNSKMNKVIDLYEELIMEHGDDTLKNIIGSKDFQKKLLAASGKKKLKKPKDPDSPKKPTTAWMLFCNDTRPQLKDENPGVKMSEISKLMSPMWQELQKSTDPDDVARVTGYKKIVDEERSVYNASKKKIKDETPPKKPRNAYQLFQKEERAKPKIDGETFGETTQRISAAWKQLKETDPEKVEEYKTRVKNWGSDTEASSSETEQAPEDESSSDEDEPGNNLTLDEASESIEEVLGEMHTDITEDVLEKMNASFNVEEEDSDEEGGLSEYDNEHMIDDDNKLYPKEDTTKAVGKVTDPENGTIEWFDSKPKAKPKTKAKPKAKDEPKAQKRPRCKKASA